MHDKLIIINFLILFLITSAIPASSEGMQENPEVKAIQLFNSGNFTEAEKIFKQLLEQNPESPISNYYYGASRTENGHFGENEISCLMTAGKHITPERLHYYLGLQHHARSNWDQALKFYNQFRLSVPEPEQKELELGKKIQLCYNQINPYDKSPEASLQQALNQGAAEDSNQSFEAASIHSIMTEEETISLTASIDDSDVLAILDSQETGEALIPPREALPNLPGVSPTIPSGDPVQFQVNSAVTYLYTSQFQTEKGKELFEKATSLQQQQKNKLAETEGLRTAYKNSQSAEEREAIAAKIIALENETILLEEEINTAYAQSRSLENEYWDSADPISRNNFLQQQEQIRTGIEEEISSLPEPEPEIPIDFIRAREKADEKASPAELVYKIQIGAYSKGVPAYRQRLYNKLALIRTIDTYTDEKGVVVYTTGNLSKYEDALKLQNQIKQEGIQDASVVSYFNGKRITLEQAKQMEANNDI